MRGVECLAHFDQQAALLFGTREGLDLQLADDPELRRLPIEQGAGDRISVHVIAPDHFSGRRQGEGGSVQLQPVIAPWPQVELMRGKRDGTGIVVDRLVADPECGHGREPGLGESKHRNGRLWIEVPQRFRPESPFP